MVKTNEDIRVFYDQYTNRQAAAGINERHLAIQKWLIKFGLKPKSKVLEIGCGIGTQTELIAKYLDVANLMTAVDISPKSIELAQQRLANFQNVNLVAADITKYDLNQKFDFIVLPDVLEHIPIPFHQDLFAKLSLLLEHEGAIIIHIPNPYFLEWCHINAPETLQLVDQPIYTDELLPKIYSVGLCLYYLETYSIWFEDGDYQILVLKKNVKRNFKELPDKEVSIIDKIKYKLSSK